jgi:hypothetical protein
LSTLVQDASALLGRHAPALKRLVPPKQRSKAWAIFYRALPTAGKTATFARWFRTRADFCRNNGSPLYGQLLDLAAADIERRGPCWAIVETYASDEAVPPAATPLAFMAAVHQVVLENPECALAAHYPSAGGDAGRPGLDAAFLEVVAEHTARVRELLRRPVQTNEVARSRVLLGGMLMVADETKLPLRVLEFGASAGLNLRWDRYRYEINGEVWGDPASPVVLRAGFIEGTPPLHLQAEVVERRGSDLSPIDPRSTAGQIQLLSHVWADQVERIERLRGAFAVAAEVDVPIEGADAASWVVSVLRDPVPGVATVIYDTFMMEYLDPAVRTQIHDTIEAAGRRADPSQPLAWLHMAPGASGREDELHLTTWPGGERRLLASCDPYAARVRWHGPGPAH